VSAPPTLARTERPFDEFQGLEVEVTLELTPFRTLRRMAELAAWTLEADRTLVF
jgi:hypothetical protein